MYPIPLIHVLINTILYEFTLSGCKNADDTVVTATLICCKRRVASGEMCSDV